MEFFGENVIFRVNTMNMKKKNEKKKGLEATKMIGGSFVIKGNLSGIYLSV